MVDLEKLQQAYEIGATHYCYESERFMKGVNGGWSEFKCDEWSECLPTLEDFFDAICEEIDYSPLNGD